MTAAWTPSLFGGGIVLDETSWVDLAPAWLTGADAWFDAIVAEAPWNQRRRRMYDQDVMEPRLTCGWRVPEAPDPAPAVASALGQLGRRADGAHAEQAAQPAFDLIERCQQGSILPIP